MKTETINITNRISKEKIPIEIKITEDIEEFQREYGSEFLLFSALRGMRQYLTDRFGKMTGRHHFSKEEVLLKASEWRSTDLHHNTNLAISKREKVMDEISKLSSEERQALFDEMMEKQQRERM